jgi:hypothetical protein
LILVADLIMCLCLRLRIGRKRGNTFCRFNTEYSRCHFVFNFQASAIMCFNFACPNTQFITISIYIVFMFFGCFLGGFYYGKIRFPPEYPYKPPGIRCLIAAVCLIILIFIYLVCYNQVHTFYDVA